MCSYSCMHAFILYNLVSDHETGVSDDKSEISDTSVEGMLKAGA